MLNLRVNKEEILKTLKILLTREMEEEIITVFKDDTIDMHEKNNKVINIINLYETLYNVLYKSLLKKFHIIQFVKKFNLTSLFLSSQISEKFKIYNLN